MNIHIYSDMNIHICILRYEYSYSDMYINIFRYEYSDMNIHIIYSLLNSDMNIHY